MRQQQRHIAQPWPLVNQARSGTATARDLWREARRFEASARRALSLAGVEFSEWLLLETLSELDRRESEGVTQSAIARSAGLTRQVASYWLTCMSERGVVDRGPDDDPRVWSVMITERGEALLRQCHERLEAAGLNR